VALTEGALRIMWYGKMKMLAAILVSVLLLGAGAGVAVRHASAGAEPDPAEAAVEPAAPVGQPQGGKGTVAQKAEIDQLRREIAKLRSELDAALREINDLRSALRPAGAPPEKGPLYRGRPVSFWREQAGDGDSAYRKDAITALGILALQHKKLI